MTGLNRNQRNTRDGRRSHEFLGTLGKEKVRHAQERSEDRRSRKLDFEIQKRRVNNDYFVHERHGRKVRSSRGHRESKLGEIFDPSSKASYRIEDHQKKIRDVREAKSEETSNNQIKFEEKMPEETNLLRHRKMEDFEVDMDDFAQARRFSAPEFDEIGIPSILQVQDDYFGDYIDEEDKLLKRRSSSRNDKFFTYEDLLRMKRDLEDAEYEEGSPKREKREEENSRCNSDVTTLTVGCSTADRMEFQSDCVDDDVVTGTLFFLSNLEYDINFTQKIIYGYIPTIFLKFVI